MDHDFLLRLATADGGVLCTRRTLGCGISRGRLQRLLNDGRWVPVRRGAWAPPGTVPTPQHRLRAVQRQHPCLVAGHRSAAALLGLDAPAPDRLRHPEVTCPRLHHHRLADAEQYRARLPHDQVAQVNGLLVTTTARTACDLALSLPEHDAVIVLDSALRTGSASREQLAAVLDTLTGRPGLRAARAALARCDPGSGSAAETKARLVLYDGGLRPRTQAAVATPDGTRYLDLLLEKPDTEPLGIEIEGFAYHGGRADHRRDVHRFNAVGSSGIRILRFTADDVFRHPRTVLHTVRRALTATFPGEFRTL